MKVKKIAAIVSAVYDYINSEKQKDYSEHRQYNNKLSEWQRTTHPAYMINAFYKKV